MSFNLLRAESSVSPRKADVDGSSSIVVEFVDSKPQQQAAAAGKKKSRRDQVVIEIDYTSVKPVVQQASEPVVAAAATSTKHTEPLKTTVDDRALEIARSFYNSPQSTNIRSITTRKELAELFRSIVGESPVSFAMVLFAMAKGMRVVNVYAAGEKLEWRTVAPSSSSSSSATATVQPIAKKSVTSSTATKKAANVTIDNDGWSTIIKGTAKPKDTVVAAVAETVTPVVAVVAAVTETVTPAPEPAPETQLIEDLQSTKCSIRKLEAEIAILVDEHSSIQEQIKSCPIERVVEFHRATIAQLEHLLDGLEAERVALIQHKNELCDKLKN
jgi:hypothetical protein